MDLFYNTSPARSLANPGNAKQATGRSHAFRILLQMKPVVIDLRIVSDTDYLVLRNTLNTHSGAANKKCDFAHDSSNQPSWQCNFLSKDTHASSSVRASAQIQAFDCLDAVGFESAEGRSGVTPSIWLPNPTSNDVGLATGTQSSYPSWPQCR